MQDPEGAEGNGLYLAQRDMMKAASEKKKSMKKAKAMKAMKKTAMKAMPASKTTKTLKEKAKPSPGESSKPTKAMKVQRGRELLKQVKTKPSPKAKGKKKAMKKQARKVPCQPYGPDGIPMEGAPSEYHPGTFRAFMSHWIKNARAIEGSSYSAALADWKKSDARRMFVESIPTPERKKRRFC
jgi:hypothetical protein